MKILDRVKNWCWKKQPFQTFTRKFSINTTTTKQEREKERENKSRDSGTYLMAVSLFTPHSNEKKKPIINSSAFALNHDYISFFLQKRYE